MKKYVAIVVAILFVFTTAGLCFAQATPNETAPGSTLPAKPAPPMKKTDAQKDRQKMTPDKEKAYKAPAVEKARQSPTRQRSRSPRSRRSASRRRLRSPPRAHRVQGMRRSLEASQ